MDVSRAGVEVAVAETGQLAAAAEQVKTRPHGPLIDPESLAELGRPDQHVMPRPAFAQSLDCAGGQFSLGSWIVQLRRREPMQVVRDDPHRPAADVQSPDAALSGKLGQPQVGVQIGNTPLGQLTAGQRADPAQQVPQLLRVGGLPARRQSLQLGGEFVGDACVEDLGVAPAEQLVQHRRIQAQRRQPPLSHRLVAVVDEGPHQAEQQLLRERGRLLGLHPQHANPARRDLLEQIAQAGHIEDVVEALAHRFQGDREVGIFACHLKQLGGPLALLPQGRTPARIASGQQQRARRAFAKSCREQGRSTDFALHGLVHGSQIDAGDDLGARRLRVGVGDAQHDAVVGAHHLRFGAVAQTQVMAQQQRQRREHRAAQRAQHANPPVTQLVAESLDHDGAIIGHHAGSRQLIAHILHEIGHGGGIEPGTARQLRRATIGLGGQPAGQLAHGLAELDRPGR